MHDRSFVLKPGIKLVRFSFTAVYQITYSKFSPQTSHLSCDFKDSYTWRLISPRLDLSRKLSPKWGGGPTFCSGPSFTRVRYNFYMREEGTLFIPKLWFYISGAIAAMNLKLGNKNYYSSITCKNSEPCPLPIWAGYYSDHIQKNTPLWLAPYHLRYEVCSGFWCWIYEITNSKF